MAKPIYHSSIEGAQHGGKGLDGFLKFAKEAGAAGAQPSNYMLRRTAPMARSFAAPPTLKTRLRKTA